MVVGRFAAGDEQRWLDALSRAMPSERVLAARDIDAPDSVELAVVASADPGLVRIALQNLLGNAWKFTANEPKARIELAQAELLGGDYQNDPAFRERFAIEHLSELQQTAGSHSRGS